MLYSDSKLHKNSLRFPENIEQLNYRYAKPIDFGYKPRSGTKTRFGGDADEDSGTRTPPLWKTTPPASPKRSHHNYRSLSPTSRTREIARGRMEMMEMVRNMTESCYELSLKDLVEKPMATDQENCNSNQSSEENTRFGGDDDGERMMFRSGSWKRQNSVRKNYDPKAQVMRSGSIRNNGGFLLKMVFPVSPSLGSSKQKKMNHHGDSLPAANGNSKISPRHSLSDGSAKGLDSDWWKMMVSGSEDGEKDGGFDGNDKGIKSSRRRGSKGCWPFIRVKRSKLPK